MIVIHYTETPTYQATFNTFAPDTPDPELHELPNTCAHFVIDKAGGIHQLVPLNIMCRHTVGLNWTAIGIEHVGYSDDEVLGDAAQMKASLELVRWLRCRYHITIRNVIGHNESLSSPYHREDVPSLRTQTHSDFNHADMQTYRHRLATAGGCPPPLPSANVQPMKRALAVAATLALALSAPALARSVVFQGAITGAHSRPAMLWLSVDGTLEASHMHWRSWGGAVAIGNGRVEWHGCTPNCGDRPGPRSKRQRSPLPDPHLRRP